jgi:hypothetical protein
MSLAFRLIVILCVALGVLPMVHGLDITPVNQTEGWKLYTNARFGFTVRYPSDWRLGPPMPDGLGITLFPPTDKSQVALSGFLNTSAGASQDGRQTLDEFALAHRRIITEVHGKKNIRLRWESDQATTLGGMPATLLRFAYQDIDGTEFVETHIVSLGRNEGRGIRIKVPRSNQPQLMPHIQELLNTYQPGRDQNNVSPFAPIKPDTAR